MNNKKNTAAGEAYAPWDLRRLPGFDFTKFTRAADKKDGPGQTLEMTLEGRKTWFRLACPKGGLVLNPLRVADTMAIFEARVFADADDRSPLASFTATRKADKAKGDAYIRATQEAALEEALKMAGFDLDVSTLAPIVSGGAPTPPTQAADAGQPAKAPLEEPKSSPAPAEADPPEQKAEHSTPPVEKAAQPAPRPAPVGPPPHAATAPRPAPVAPQPHAAPSQKKEKPAPAVVNIGDARQTVAAQNKPDGQEGTDTPPAAKDAPAADPAPEASAGSDAPAPAAYTADMTVEEICGLMTLEQARSFKVLDGICKGWTLEQVAKDRPPSLKWLRYTAPFANNELKAAAGIVLNDLELKMAG